MKNQNPLEPMSNTEFVSQLASFSALQNQNQSLYYANASYASSLVGKTVTVARSSGSKLLVDTGVVESLQLVDGEFMVSVNGKQYTLANIMTIDANTRTPTDGGKNNSGFDGAYAVSLIEICDRRSGSCRRNQRSGPRQRFIRRSEKRCGVCSGEQHGL